MQHRRQALILSFLTFGIIFALNFNYTSFERERSALNHVARKISYFLEGGLAAVLDSKPPTVALNVPFYRQEHALTCETAALRMALAFQGAEVSENDLLQKLNKSISLPMDEVGLWGDPTEGFVGKVDGSIFEYTGFGVYEEPIHDLAENYRDSRIIGNATIEEVLKEVSRGNPVIAWGLLSNTKPKYWLTPQGKLVEVYPGEHARVVMGYTGTLDKPEKIILMDPLYGKIRMSATQFMRDWAVMNNRAVVVYHRAPGASEFALTN